MKLSVCILLACGLAHAQTRTVERVIDGDTLVLNGGETVRLIGIDAPEMASARGRAQCYALRAAGELSRLVDGKAVLVERDPQGEAADRYGRTLAYLYAVDSGKMLNGEMVRRGFARAYLRFPFRYSDLFKTFESIARQRHSGLWSRC